MSIYRALALMLTAMLCSTGVAQAQVKFADYPAKLYKGKKAVVDLYGSPVRNPEISFAGKYSYFEIGCGTSCMGHKLFDVRTGREIKTFASDMQIDPYVYCTDGTDGEVVIRPNSRLLIVRGSTNPQTHMGQASQCEIRFFVEQNGRLKRLNIANTKNQNKTDWTPKLQSMFKGCAVDLNMNKLPKKYKDSITSIKKYKRSEGTEDSVENITAYTLKNSIAFGKPLLKIEEIQGYEWGDTSLYFQDNNFLALRKLFEAPYDAELIARDDALGYEAYYDIGSVSLTFDPKNHSITCSGGL